MSREGPLSGQEGVPQVKTQSNPDTEITRLCDNRGRDWSDAATSQEMPRINRPHQKLARAKEGFFLKSQREGGPANTFILDFWAPEL